MKTFDSTLWPAFLHRLRNLITEGWPVIQRFDAKEFYERIQLVYVILHWCARQAPPILPVECATCNSGLSTLVLDIVRLICQ